MLRAYKYRIYPTEEQKVMLAKTFGCCRFVYNWARELKEKAYKEGGENISEFEMKKRVVHELRETAPWLKEVSSTSIEYAIADIYRAYNNFFAKRAKYPKYRNKRQRQHYHDRPTKGRGVRVDFERGFISIPKIKEIPCVFHRRFNGIIKQVGVELLPSGKYHISVLVEDNAQLPEKAPIRPENTLGIDTGLTHFAVLSDGQVYEPTHFAKKEQRKLKLLNRRLEKKEKGSRQFCILKRRIAKLHENVANRRQDYIHKLTHYIACENQATTICVENLNIKGLRRSKFLSYSIDDAAIGEFYRQLKYKCDWAGKNYIKIDRFAPSSKRCYHCGYIFKGLSLKDREWTCPECGTHHDRDLNAAINIKHFGLSVKEALPSERRKVTPVEQPLMDERSSEPKKLCCDFASANETGKVKGKRAQMP